MDIIDLHFDKGNGASFKISLDGNLVRCFVRQDNSFLSGKASPGQSFPAIFGRYARLISDAATICVARLGVVTESWGNVVTAQDMQAAQQRIGQSTT
jgi:hypothetical protein